MRTHDEWLHTLRAGYATQDAAISDLRNLLFRAVLFFSRNLDDFRDLGREVILQVAEDCAQEALSAVMNHISDFRGDNPPGFEEGGPIQNDQQVPAGHFVKLNSLSF